MLMYSICALECTVATLPRLCFAERKKTHFFLFLRRFLRSHSYMPSCLFGELYGAGLPLSLLPFIDAVVHSFACTIIFQLFQIYLCVFFISIFRWIHRWLCVVIAICETSHCSPSRSLPLSRSVFDCFRTSQFCRICVLAFFREFFVVAVFFFLLFTRPSQFNILLRTHSKRSIDIRMHAHITHIIQSPK